MTINARVYEDEQDPGGYKDWDLDFSDEFEATELIDLSSVVTTIISTAEGLLVDGAGDPNPIALDDTSKKLVYWASVEEAKRELPEFEDKGLLLYVKFNFTSTPQGRKYERTVGITFVQR